MSFLYQLVKYSGRIGLPLFFGKLEINGRENIPDDLPYLIAPNHQNAFLDAILMGVYSKKPMHFLTRSDVFVAPYIGALTTFNMMPVYRMRDGFEKLSKNEEVFAKCAQILKKGQPVLIFPEGNMGDKYYLRSLTKGTGRLAMQTQSNLDKDLMILPVGINYFDHYMPRNKCIINYGKPIRARDYSDSYNANNAKGLILLRNDLSAAMKNLLLIPSKDNYEEKVKALNLKNEKFPFAILKDKIARGKFETLSGKPKLRIWSKALTLFNPIAINVVLFLLKKKIKQKQFTISIKYTLGLYLSVIWWMLLFSLVYALSNIYWATGITLLSIFMLFVRSEILKISE